MSANTRTAMTILAAAGFAVSMFVGALTAPMVLTGLREIWAGTMAGGADDIALLGLLAGIAIVAVLNLRHGWARIVLAVALGLVLGSLAPPMTGGGT